MEAIESEDIPKIAVPVERNAAYDVDGEQPSVSTQQTINPATAEQIRSTNTYRLEFPVILLFFSWNLSGTVFQNQILYQTCMLEYNKTTCDTLANDMIPDEYKVIANNTIGFENTYLFVIYLKLSKKKELEEELEQLASKVIMARIILESIIPAFISFLIGPWSDKFGRKPILVGTFFGTYYNQFHANRIRILISFSDFYSHRIFFSLCNNVCDFDSIVILFD